MTKEDIIIEALIRELRQPIDQDNYAETMDMLNRKNKLVECLELDLETETIEAINMNLFLVKYQNDQRKLWAIFKNSDRHFDIKENLRKCHAQPYRTGTHYDIYEIKDGTPRHYFEPEEIAALWPERQIKEKYGTTDLEELNETLRGIALQYTDGNVEFFATRQDANYFILTVRF